MPPSPRRTPWDVLVVDDDEQISELIVSYFGTLGISVTGAFDGRAAVSTLDRSNGRYGLVITDLNLPGADGFAVLQAAKKANASCYVVIITGYASLDSAIHAVRVGAYDYLTKPFSLGQLDVILKRITDRASLEQENRELGRYPVATTAYTPAVVESREPQTTRLEQTLMRVEQALARIESRLDLATGSTLHRR